MFKIVKAEQLSANVYKTSRPRSESGSILSAGTVHYRKTG